MFPWLCVLNDCARRALPLPDGLCELSPLLCYSASLSPEYATIQSRKLAFKAQNLQTPNPTNKTDPGPKRQLRRSGSGSPAHLSAAKPGKLWAELLLNPATSLRALIIGFWASEALLYKFEPQGTWTLSPPSRASQRAFTCRVLPLIPTFFFWVQGLLMKYP